MEIKICSKCGEEKSLEEFQKDHRLKSGRGPNCKKCHSNYSKSRNARKKQKEYYESNKEKIKSKSKKYSEENKEDISKKRKQKYQENIEQNRMKQREDYHKNIEQKRESSRLNYAKHREKRLAYQKEYRTNPENRVKINKRTSNKKKTNPSFKLRHTLRNRVLKALNGNRKPGSAIKDLGCSVEQLKEHLESQFQSGMTWENWTIDGWHIDHIKPLASFDLTDRNQFLEACHYTNLQPMWAKENLSKGAKSEE